MKKFLLFAALLAVGAAHADDCYFLFNDGKIMPKAQGVWSGYTIPLQAATQECPTAAQLKERLECGVVKTSQDQERAYICDALNYLQPDDYKIFKKDTPGFCVTKDKYSLTPRSIYAYYENEETCKTFSGELFEKFVPFESELHDTQQAGDNCLCFMSGKRQEVYFKTSGDNCTTKYGPSCMKR